MSPGPRIDPYPLAPAMKPMLAGKVPEDLEELKFPVLATPKIDGIRCLTMEGGAPVSRSLKAIPNAHIRLKFAEELAVYGFDGELTVPGAATFGDVSSAVMGRRFQPEFRYLIFDSWRRPGGYQRRIESLKGTLLPPWAELLLPQLIHGVDALNTYEGIQVAAGYEGVMVRDPAAPYKFGRSTTREGGLLKLKRFEEDEAVVLTRIEEQANGNEATIDALGHTQRSTHQANKTGKGTLGALRVRAINGRFAGAEFKIGTGFTAEQRQTIWDAPPDDIIDRVVKFRHQPHGADAAPRIPSFQGFRHPDDMEPPA